ncbi:MAG: hypothetical protein KIT72_01240 [Polyangiaceae bacterium]|nr:hypothetical protein [Polyangiaceae bacterium]MCW5789020.1 hypothetical protein [Polyangiaceae bacterium]
MSRLVALVSLVVVVVLPAPVAAMEAPEPPPSPWRAELQLHGAWLPGGFEARGGVGVGLAARFHGFEAGPEVWRYHLTLEDRLVGERQSFGSTMIVPLRVGYQHRFAELPIVVGVAAGLGVIDGPAVITAFCRHLGYSGWSPGVRGFVGLALGYFVVGPHVAYGWGPEGSDSQCGALGPDPDPELRDYPRRLPLGLQLGLSAILGAP